MSLSSPQRRLRRCPCRLSYRAATAPRSAVRAVRPREAGGTLVELMVALLIGLLVVGAALAGHAATGRTARLVAVHAEMHENALIGLALLTRELQLAGYARPIGAASASGAGAPFLMARTHAERPVFGCAHGLNGNAARNQAAAWDASVCAPGSGARDDVLEIVYEADLVNSSATSGGLPSDCIGSGLPASTITLDEDLGQTLSYYLTRNRYYLSVGSSGRSELYCASAQGAPGQPLVDNVAALRFWYGEADAAEPRRVVRYVGAEAVGDWRHVRSVRLCLLMRGSEAVLGQDDALDYRDCDGTMARANDRHPRRAYAMTATLRGSMAW